MRVCAALLVVVLQSAFVSVLLFRVRAFGAFALHLYPHSEDSGT